MYVAPSELQHCVTCVYHKLLSSYRYYHGLKRVRPSRSGLIFGLISSFMWHILLSIFLVLPVPLPHRHMQYLYSWFRIEGTLLLALQPVLEARAAAS